jgi:GNAT superfamily N-acetyltransferase
MSQQNDAPTSVSEMKILNQWDFAPDIKILHVEKFAQAPYQQLVDETLGSQHPFLQWQDRLTEPQKIKLEALKAYQKNDYKLRLAAVHNGELIGVSFSFQESTTDLLMGVSTIRPEFRGRGLYTALAQKTLDLSKEAGFQAVNSRHLLTNNAILIAKLKLGFHIFSIETTAVHGTLIKMVYHHNELMRQSLRFRSGEIHLFSEEEIYEYYGGPTGQ